MLTEAAAAFLAKAFVTIAVLAGGITSMFLEKTANWKDRLGAFVIGCAASVFSVPFLLEWVWRGDPPKSAEAFAYYLVATCANAALPPFIQFVRERARNPLGGSK